MLLIVAATFQAVCQAATTCADRPVRWPARELVKAAFAGNPSAEIYLYPGIDHAFARASGHAYNKPAAVMAHSRSIALFRRVMGLHLDLLAVEEKALDEKLSERKNLATARRPAGRAPGEKRARRADEWGQHPTVNTERDRTRLLLEWWPGMGRRW